MAAVNPAPLSDSASVSTVRAADCLHAIREAEILAGCLDHMDKDDAAYPAVVDQIDDLEHRAATHWNAMSSVERAVVEKHEDGRRLLARLPQVVKEEQP